MKLSKQFVLVTIVAIISGTFFQQAKSQQLPDFTGWFESAHDANEKLPQQNQDDLISSLLAEIHDLKERLEGHDTQIQDLRDYHDGRLDEHDQRLQTAESNISTLQSDSGIRNGRPSDPSNLDEFQRVRK